jgi:hypothetical protein
MLVILKELMHRTFVEITGRAPTQREIPRPCEHFDLIAGTGTGGLIAIMLGRLRLDVDTCMDLYVRMTRRVFETDKTILGMPYKRTMFKASKLEEVIRECVREHTRSDDEGNDSLSNAIPMNPENAGGSVSSAMSPGFPRRQASTSSNWSRDMPMSPTEGSRRSFSSSVFGNSQALLYDTRETRTKTAVAAVLKGTTVTTLLRSYDSRREPAPDVNCKIWEAGRATCAIQMAFKPIQIGQSWYLDEGVGRYNPAPLILDEAVQNEWPGREVGVFISIGTGRRPPGTNNRQHEWWEDFLGSNMSEFAEARRRLVSKLEGCEETHQYMLQQHLANRKVNADNYYRLNVEVGVGEFGMNEWNRISEVKTNTRTYLQKPDVEEMNQVAAAKIAKIHRHKVRYEGGEARRDQRPTSNQDGRFSWDSPWDRPLPAAPAAVELPGNDMFYQTQGFRPGAQQYEHRPSVADQKYVVVADDYHYAQPTPSESANPRTPPQRPAQPAGAGGSPYQSQNSLYSNPAQYQNYQYSGNSSPPRVSHDSQQRPSPPPLPPKTPLANLPYPPGSMDSAVQSPPSTNRPRTFMNMGDLGRRLPYPDIDGPPPPVNTANKPQVSR